MHNPCFECYIRRGHSYTPECYTTCEYAHEMKDRGDRIEELEEILKSVMRHVDRWLTADDFDKSEVGRAEIMNKRIPESFDRRIERIYLITVFDKCEPDERWGYNIGCTRSVGWRPTFEMAEEAVKTNMCDIWEFCYDYACIEELTHELYPFAEERWFYKFNREKGVYEEMDEPVFLKNHGPIGGIG